MIYGVMQTHYGHEYRWLFTGEEILNQLSGRNYPIELGEETWVSYWPIGGSNSSDTKIARLDSDEAIKNFLTAPEYNDYEDPMLVDIAEFLVTVDVEDGSCTQEYLDKFGLKVSELIQTDDINGHYATAKKMIEELKAVGYEDFDYNNPFYGNNRDMRYSELYSLWEQCCNRGRA